MDNALRSVLYLPASNIRALEKAASLPCDALIFDLEDAVAPLEKTLARAHLVQALAEIDYGARLRVVRINGLMTQWGAADVAALAGSAFDAVLLPKVESPQDIGDVAALLPGISVWAMLETARGVLNAAAIADCPDLQALVMGTNDLQRDLGCRLGPGRPALLPALCHCLLAARAADKLIVDGVYPAFRDQVGLAQECEQGRDLGFDGKTLIHPVQIDVANRAFTPTEAELAEAKAQIDAHAAAIAAGQGVAVLDGRIVENLHVEMARRVLAKAGLM